MREETNQYATGQLDTELPAAPTQPTRRDRNRLLAYLLIGIGVAMLFRNFNSDDRGSHWQNEQFTVPFNAAQVVDLRINSGTGNINVQAGSPVEYLVTGNAAHRGDLDIDDEGNDEGRELTLQADGGGATNWTMHLNASPRYTIDVNANGGQSFLDLSQLKVQELNVDGGSGNQVVVLPQSGQGPFTAAFDVGSGNLTLDVPDGRPVQVRIDIGSGNISSGPLQQIEDRDGEDGVYQSPGYDKAPESERVDVEIDIGSGNVVLK